MVWNYSAFEDEALAADELGAFRAAGGRSIVETTTIGIGRDPEGLRRVAASAGVQIVMGTGWYREAVYPDYVARSSVDQLADRLVADIVDGVGDTGVRAGRHRRDRHRGRVPRAGPGARVPRRGACPAADRRRHQHPLPAHRQARVPSRSTCCSRRGWRRTGSSSATTATSGTCEHELGLLAARCLRPDRPRRVPRPAAGRTAGPERARPSSTPGTATVC